MRTIRQSEVKYRGGVVMSEQQEGNKTLFVTQNVETDRHGRTYHSGIQRYESRERAEKDFLSRCESQQVDPGPSETCPGCGHQYDRDR